MPDQPRARKSTILAVAALFTAANAALFAQLDNSGRLEHGVYDRASTALVTGHSSELPQVLLDSPFSSVMLDFQNRQSEKELNLLRSLPSGDQPHVVLGGQFRGSGLIATTNTADKFPYLGRFPTDFAGRSASDLRILQANQSAAMRINHWSTAYAETLFSDVFSFPDFRQGSFQMRQAYLVFGDLNESPLYAFLGKKNVSFGDMGTLSPFTQAVTWHYFAPLGEGGGVGYSSDRMDLSFTLLNGSRGMRVVDSERRGIINNFAANIDLRLLEDDDLVLAVGAGYLHGTIYDQITPEHLNASLTGPRNPAWDVNGRLQLGDLRFALEYVQTDSPWPATNHVVSAFRAEFSAALQKLGLPLTTSVSWSSGKQGHSWDPFEFNNQLVVGLRHDVDEQMRLSIEYVRSSGFAPLINITTVSDRDVIQNSIVLGCTLFL